MRLSATQSTAALVLAVLLAALAGCVPSLPESQRAPATEEAAQTTVTATIQASPQAVSMTPLEATAAPGIEGVAAEPVALEGTPWSLVSYRTIQGETVAVLPEAPVVAYFQAGQLSGNGGCNNYFATYTADGANLTIQPGGTTRKLCAEPVMAQEEGYLAALRAVAAYSMADGQFQVYDAAGNLLLVFGVSQPTPLTGTTWRLLFVNNDQGALVTALAGSQITALFAEDGRISGSAGCNDYTASYELSGNQITIGPAASTRKMCAEPQGVMEQEAAYLAALSTATSYAIRGNDLELATAEGAAGAVYRAGGEASAVAQEPVGASTPVPADAGGEGATAAPPQTAEPPVTVEPTPTPTAALTATLAAAAVSPDALEGVIWQWQSVTDPVNGLQEISAPERYTLAFQPSGALRIQADCNRGAGRYTVEDSSLVLEVAIMTRALCPKGSLSDDFVKSLNAVSAYSFQDGKLLLDLAVDGGTMTFTP